MKRTELPPGVFRRHAGRKLKTAGPEGTYYKATADGERRIWVRLTPAREGLPAMYQALARLMDAEQHAHMIPKLIADWQRDVMSRHAEKTQRDERAMCARLADSLSEVEVAALRPPHVAQLLAPLKAKPRTHNRYRALLRELMRYAMERGLRDDNPVDPIKTASERARTRYITDSELRRIKVAGMYGDDGLRTRSGPMLCALIDMAYLTGQRIGDLLALEWYGIGTDGITFKPAKVAKSTGVQVLVGWSPALRDVVRRLRELRKERRGFAPQVFTTQDGKAYTYWGASTAWRRAVRRSGVKGCTFHDIRAKALTDLERKAGMQAARRMGGHSTEGQTADYVRTKGAIKAPATR